LYIALQTKDLQRKVHVLRPDDEALGSQAAIQDKEVYYSEDSLWPKVIIGCEWTV
jgi:hypothetical protein